MIRTEESGCVIVEQENLDATTWKARGYKNPKGIVDSLARFQGHKFQLCPPVDNLALKIAQTINVSGRHPVCESNVIILSVAETGDWLDAKKGLTPFSRVQSLMNPEGLNFKTGKIPIPRFIQGLENFWTSVLQSMQMLFGEIHRGIPMAMMTNLADLFWWEIAFLQTDQRIAGAQARAITDLYLAGNYLLDWTLGRPGEGESREAVVLVA